MKGPGILVLHKYYDEAGRTDPQYLQKSYALTAQYPA